MSDLVERQQQFAADFARLLTEAGHLGYQVSLDEVYRPPAVAKFYAQTGVGIANSLHCLRLAADINLWKDGNLCSHKSDYQPLGDFWASLHHDNAWGGNFTTSDYRHFSRSYEGVK